MPRDIPRTRIRNIGIMAHIDAGKTTCTERVLFYTGLVHKPGDVHHGTATTDFDEEERKRGITITAACVTTPWIVRGERHEIRILDTPGHVDFAIEVERSLRVLDGAVFVLDASQGVEAQSEAVWRQADRYAVPRITFVNKMDKVGADFDRCMTDLRERLGANPVAVQIPLGEGDTFRGVVDLVTMQAFEFDERDRGRTVVPAAVPETAGAARTRMIEACAEVDEEVFEAFVTGTDPKPEAIERALRKGTIEGRLQVVTCGSAYRYKGVQPLLDAVVAYLPSPAPREDEPLAALVFKTQIDRSGALAFVRVYSGRMRRGDVVLLDDRKSRIGRLFVLHADQREEIEEARAGDIVAVAGLENTRLENARTGHTLCAPEHPVRLESIDVPEPVLEVALEPRTSEDRERLGTALGRLLAEDPSLRSRIDEESGQTILRGMGELHVEIAVSKLSRAGIDVRVSDPEVAYRDTFARAIQVEHKHDKQNGGVGQFARVVLAIEPAPPGSGIHFEDATIGGAVPKTFVPGVEKGVRSACARGVRHGYPLVDLVVRLVDGAHHVKDSSPFAFEIASSLAVQEAARRAGLVLLEPIMAVEVTVPEASLGDAIGDLSSRRGAIGRITDRSGVKVVEARVPLASLFGFVSSLRGRSHGRGSVSMKPDGYEPVPQKLAESVVGA
jgi:elongation factor G